VLTPALNLERVALGQQLRPARRSPSRGERTVDPRRARSRLRTSTRGHAPTDDRRRRDRVGRHSRERDGRPTTSTAWRGREGRPHPSPPQTREQASARCARQRRALLRVAGRYLPDAW
jgi:hypothetical protein